MCRQRELLFGCIDLGLLLTLCLAFKSKSQDAVNEEGEGDTQAPDTSPV